MRIGTERKHEYILALAEAVIMEKVSIERILEKIVVGWVPFQARKRPFKSLEKLDSLYPSASIVYKIVLC